jgi:hypothetical protein
MYFLFVKSDKLLVSPHIISINRIYYETYICIEEIEEELEELSLENEPKKRIPTLAEAKSAYEIIYDRLSQSKDFDEEGIEILLKLENLLNKKTELKQKNINDYF